MIIDDPITEPMSPEALARLKAIRIPEGGVLIIAKVHEDDMRPRFRPDLISRILDEEAP